MNGQDYTFISQMIEYCTKEYVFLILKRLPVVGFSMLGGLVSILRAKQAPSFRFLCAELTSSVFVGLMFYELLTYKGVDEHLKHFNALLTGFIADKILTGIKTNKFTDKIIKRLTGKNDTPKA